MDVFDLQAKLGLDKSGLSKGLSEAESSLSSFAAKATTAFGNFAKLGAKAFAGVSAAAVASATAIGKQAVAAFGEYEQLIGGVDTIFGHADRVAGDYADDISSKVRKANEMFGEFASQGGNWFDSWSTSMLDKKIAEVGKMTDKEQQKYLDELREQYDQYGKYVGMSESAITAAAEKEYQDRELANEQVLANASKAWKTAGMSANAYMQNITGFSASLLQGLDGDVVKAAEYGDRAIADMADNANKMGTAIESIQWAYQGLRAA